MKNVFRTQKGQDLPNLSEDDARLYLEKLRWPAGPACPHYQSRNVYEMRGKSIRPGLRRCRECRKQFSVRIGTIFQESHLPLSIWVKAFHLVCSSKKGISALQLQRNLGLGSYRTAWFLAHRIRWAMKNRKVAGTLQGIVEADETYVHSGSSKGRPKKRGRGTAKTPVMVVVERDGKAYSKPVDRVTALNLKTAIKECAVPTATIYTDEFPSYSGLEKDFSGGHQVVNHGKGEYSRNGINTNTAESYFALLKRGLHGIFHHVSRKHLHRYCTEFEFRWNCRRLGDLARRDEAIALANCQILRYRAIVGN